MFESVQNEFTRRALLITPLAFAGLVAISTRKGKESDDGSGVGSNEKVTVVRFDDLGHSLGPEQLKKVVRTASEWHKRLTAEQYYVTRQNGTDTAFTGTYYQLHAAAGLFRCICCENAVFSSDTKFDSGTGWPSFWAPIAKENIRTRSDLNMFIERTEVHCTLCDAHLGHVFNDGPEPTYLRYCINESALRFIPRVA